LQTAHSKDQKRKSNRRIVCQVKTEADIKCLRRKSHVVAKRKEVNWLEYYKSIANVCPWSYKSFIMGKIITIPYNDNTFMTFASAFRSCKDMHGVETDCFVYTCEGKGVRWLESMVDEMNGEYPDAEWLYSTPEDNSGNATPIPVLIQQHRAKLEYLRDKIGYEDQDCTGSEDE
jgi:hypothetical protein